MTLCTCKVALLGGLAVCAGVQRISALGAAGIDCFGKLEIVVELCDRLGLGFAASGAVLCHNAFCCAGCRLCLYPIAEIVTLCFGNISLLGLTAVCAGVKVIALLLAGRLYGLDKSELVIEFLDRLCFAHIADCAAVRL